MNASFAGVSLLNWVLLALLMAGGAWLTSHIYRSLIRIKDSDELFITPEELSQMRSHVRDVDFWVKAARRTTFALFAVVVVILALGGRP